ncbi:MAG TPA: helix-turn-helix domain-containing protein [Acidimicrobiales bacterium]
MKPGQELIDEGGGRGRRAVAMPPDERRAAIACAALPLLLERGLAVTTRQIAQAAGIAEGTIFRAFPDKEAVVRAAVEAAFDPSASEQALAAIDHDQSFEAQLAEAAAILQRRLSVIWRLVTIVGEKPEPPPRPPESAALTALFAAHADRVRLDPAAAARQLRALTLAVSHPALADEPLSPPEIVSLLLDGIRARVEALDGVVNLAAPTGAKTL